MKKLIFDCILNKGNNSSKSIESDSFNSINNFTESCSKGFLKLSLSLFSDKINLNDLDSEDILAYENMKHLTNYVLYYVFNILLNNNAVEQKKKPPYDINLVQKISYREKKFQLYLFLDDKIFGLCVGTKFKNILSLIQSLFPLIAKTDYLNEVRFFPISRMEFILNE